MDTPTENRAQRLYLQILADLEIYRLGDSSARDAVLLRICEQVGELAEIAEGALEKFQVPDNEARVLKQAIKVCLTHISLKLLRILSGTDFYLSRTSSVCYYAGQIHVDTRRRAKAHPAYVRAIAA